MYMLGTFKCVQFVYSGKIHQPDISQLLDKKIEFSGNFSAPLSSPPLSSPVAFGASHLKNIRNWNKKKIIFLKFKASNVVILK